MALRTWSSFDSESVNGSIGLPQRQMRPNEKWIASTAFAFNWRFFHVPRPWLPVQTNLRRSKERTDAVDRFIRFRRLRIKGAVLWSPYAVFGRRIERNGRIGLGISFIWQRSKWNKDEMVLVVLRSNEEIWRHRRWFASAQSVSPRCEKWQQL